MTGREPDGLAAELRRLGRDVEQRVAGPAAVDRVAAAVTGRLDGPAPARAVRVRPVRRRGLRLAAAVALAAAALLAVTPAGRAAVAGWFRFAAVLVQLDDAAPPAGTPSPAPAVTGRPGTDLAAAAAEAGVEPLVPAVLGPPDAVTVSADRRVLTLGWDGGPDGAVRLDLVAGSIEPVFLKTATDVEFVTVGGASAVWIGEPHTLVVLAPDGTTREEPPRLAGRTLLWESGTTTLRLEGDLTRGRALEIAESVG